MNPFTNYIAEPYRLNFGYDTTGWLRTISGVRAGSVGLDPEQNVLTGDQ